MSNQEQVERWHTEWLNSPPPHWGDHIDWHSADEIARRLDEADAPDPESCCRAPVGYYCTLPKGHFGDCKTYPVPA